VVVALHHFGDAGFGAPDANRLSDAGIAPGEPARVLQRCEHVTASTLLPTGNGDRLTSRRSHRLESGREPMPAKPAASRPAVIFIATKQEWIGRSLESILAPLGYAVVTTYTARDALERARRIRPDAIIVDAFLPDGDGRDLCRQLRARELITPSTPIVLTVPQSPTRRDRLAALQAGAWDCLGPPRDAEGLAAVLAAVLPGERAAMRAGPDAVQVRKLAERLASAILAVPPAASEPAPSLQLHAGCVGVADFHAASIDPVELLLRATAALQKARSDPQGGWLRAFEESAAGN